MVAKIYITFSAICMLHVVSSGLLGLAVQPLTTPILTEIKTVISNLQNVLTGSGEKADKLLQKLKYKSSDPEGILGLVKEIDMAISQVVPVDVATDISPCFDVGKPNISEMVKKAGEGAQACYNQVDTELQPYRNNLQQTIQKTYQLMTEAQNNLTSCILTLGGIVSCTAEVKKQVFSARDRYVADSDYETKASQVVKEFQDCSILVEDNAIATAVKVIQTARQCIRSKISPATK